MLNLNLKLEAFIFTLTVYLINLRNIKCYHEIKIEQLFQASFQFDLQI